MSLAHPDQERIVVETTTGPVEGSVWDGVASFKGIPFAAPPFGANRFKPPQPPQPWREVRRANAYGWVSPQSPYPEPFRHMLGDAGATGEDCLNVNVWTPAPRNGRRPVMVWIHGGAFLRGSGAIPVYDGTRFARDGVVCVTINYRLGADGFLWLGEGAVNRGLLDQLAALRWVQANIEAFGGDPASITVFGESAGAFSVASLIASEQSSGLFQRAILQSGAGHHVISAATAQLISAMLCERLGVPQTADALAAVPIERFTQAQSELDVERAMQPDPRRWGEVATNGMLFEPVIDGDLLRERPVDAMVKGAGARLQVMVGTTSEEWRFFTVPTGVIDHITEERVLGLAQRQGLDPANAVATYREASQGATAGDLYTAIITDSFFRVPAIRVAEAHARNRAQAYVYEFAWRSPMFDGRLGACHALELGFVFDNLDRAGPMLGDDASQSLADEVHRTWVEFATSGNPGWRCYDLSRRPVKRFGGEGGSVVDDPGASTRQLWEGIR
ncbi:MAG: carboxylesterase/lipase family protein [Chloroflexi bacterium]|nr:MAG: carboxylesterase/lipase family protein [Chloroflexota bacterium]TME45309.1 MAG: carboxylesterase/lipase family protein [Chloroflexota bacterium]